MAGGKKKAQTQEEEKVWIDRLSKKEEGKNKYEDPNSTFKPAISKKTEKMLKNRGNAFEVLDADSKKRQEKEKNLKTDAPEVNIKA